MATEEKRHPCDVCGTDMYDPKMRTSVTGIEISVKPSDEMHYHSEFKRIIETFGKSDFKICYVCWVKSLGVKPVSR